MLKSTLTTAALALLLAGPAFADHDDDRRRGDDRDRYDHRYDHRDDDRDHDHDRNRGKGHGKGRGKGNGVGHAYGHDRDHDWDRRRHDHDWNRYDRWRHDGWRYDRGNDDYFWNRGNDWRFVPPARYRADRRYRSGYELAWRDFERYARSDRDWRRRSHHSRLDFGYLSGYEAGWRDAERYYRAGYRPRYWSQDPYGSWFFGFRLNG